MDNGVHVPVLISDTLSVAPDQGTTFVLDLTELKRAEDARESERKLQMIIETIPALVWSAYPDGRADFLNRHYLEFVGLTREQAKDWWWVSAIHPDDLPALIATWRRVLDSEAPGEAEARLRRYDGQYRWLLFRAKPLRNESGAIIAWCGTNVDIDDRKRAEESLEKARAERAHAARVATLGALTASITHEINQPLAGIVTNASSCRRFLDADPPNSDGAREAARRLIRDANRAADVVKGLRAMYSKSELSFELVDLNRAAREVVAMSLADIQRNRVALQLDLAKDLPSVAGDRIQLQQVILNLLRNACDAMSEVDDRPRKLVIRSERASDGGVRLSVRDTGVGFDHQDMSKLFDAFYTTKSDGMGIGLSVSRSIVDRHHGQLWAEGNVEPGVTFFLSIPVSAA